jgi:hypothetical protein
LPAAFTSTAKGTRRVLHGNTVARVFSGRRNMIWSSMQSSATNR